MSRRPLLPLLLLSACSAGPPADLSAISEARSLGSEWALVNEQERAAHLTTTYARTMRESLRQQLESVAKSLTKPHSGYADEIAALLREPEDAPPAALLAHTRKLKQIEDDLESA